VVGVSWNELREPTGHLLVIGLVEDGSDLWKIVRKPDGKFWDVTALVSSALTGETLRVETDDRIFDVKRLAECEELYDQYSRRPYRAMCD